MQQEETEMKLEQIIPDIAIDINSLGHLFFHGDSTPFNQIDIDIIQGKIDSHLDSIGISHETYFSIYKENNPNLLIRNTELYKTELLESNIRTCMSCIVSFSIVDKENSVQKENEAQEDYEKRLMSSSTFQYYAPITKFRKDNKDIIWLSLYQPNAFSNALRSMLLLFAINILLLSVLLYLFYHLLKLLSNYKKISQLKEDFFNNMTHEFKTPLSSIRLASRVLRQNKDAEKSKSYHDLIEKESKTLETQIDKLLELSYVDNSSLQLEKKEIDLHELIKEIPNRLKPMIESKQANLSLQLDLVNPKIIADPYHLSNSISNLVENSLKYGANQINIWISSYGKGDSKFIMVRDNGPGIKPEFQAHIFERFYRAKKSNEYKTQGFGIGLSYVKSIIEAHNGNIQLNSNYTDGSEFIIKLKS